MYICECGRKYLCKYLLMYVCMYVYMCLCMYVCMYVGMYVYKYTCTALRRDLAQPHPLHEKCVSRELLGQ